MPFNRPPMIGMSRMKQEQKRAKEKRDQDEKAKAETAKAALNATKKSVGVKVASQAQQFVTRTRSSFNGKSEETLDSGKGASSCPPPGSCLSVCAAYCSYSR